jgi:hypothetical protein
VYNGKRQVRTTALTIEDIFNPTAHIIFTTDETVEHVTPDVFILPRLSQVGDVREGERLQAHHTAGEGDRLDMERLGVHDRLKVKVEG